MIRHLCIAAALVAAVATARPWPAAAFKRLAPGERLGDRPLVTAEGDTVALADTLGARATVVVFWANWSPRSKDALTDMQELLTHHGDAGLRVVAINVDGTDPQHDPGGEAADSAARLGLTYPMLQDPRLDTYQALGVVAVPSLVLLDGEGRVASLIAGYSRTVREELAQGVLQVLTPSAPPAADAVTADTYTPRGEAGRYYRTATLLREKHRTSRAVEYLARALAEDPMYAEARAALVATLRELGRAEEAARVELVATEGSEYCLVPRRARTMQPW